MKYTMKRVQCPQCSRYVVWNSFYPKKQLSSCIYCGMAWKEQLEEMHALFGIFLGKWSVEESNQVERNLSDSDIQPAQDWFFFKGKSLYTAWRMTESEHLIVASSAGELTYFVALATQNENWYEEYLRLSD